MCIGREIHEQQGSWKPGVVGVVAASLIAIPITYLALQDPEFLHLGSGLSCTTILTFAVALAVSILILRHSEFGLYILVGFVYLNLSQILVRFHGFPSLLRLIVLPMFLSVWTSRYLVRRQRLSIGTLSILLVCYNLVLLTSSTFAKNPSLANKRFIENLAALAIYVLVVGLASSVNHVRRSVGIILIAGILLGALTITQVTTGNFQNEFGGFARIKHAHIYGKEFEPRVAGPLGDPNYFAQILLILVSLSLYTAWGQTRWFWKLSAYMSTLVIGTTMVLTYSRGGTLALACVLILILLDCNINLRQLAFLLVLVAGVFLLLPIGFRQRLTTIKQILPGSEQVIHPDSSFEKRKLLTKAAFKIFVDHPVFGVGAGNYTVYYEEYADKIGSAAREYEDPAERHYPHSLYLEIGAETGLLGLCIFVLILGTCFVYLRRARSRFIKWGDTYMGGLAKAFEISLIGYLISSIFLHGSFQRYLWLIFAFSAVLHDLSETRNNEKISLTSG
jgi:hypothetical protein